MRTALLFAAIFAAACKPQKPMVETPPAPAPVPVAEQNAVEEYASDLASDIKLAQDAKTKADAARKSADEANRISE
jgi:hypothetical protein